MIKKACLIAALSTAMFATAAQAEDEYFLNVPGINGAAEVIGFQGQIPVESWSLGMTKGLCQAFHFSKVHDPSSGQFTEAVLLGVVYPSATLSALKLTGDGPFVYLKITMLNGIFKSFQQSGNDGTGQLPMEQISYQPASIKVQSYKQNEVGDPFLFAENTVICQRPAK